MGSGASRPSNNSTSQSQFSGSDQNHPRLSSGYGSQTPRELAPPYVHRQPTNVHPAPYQAYPPVYTPPPPSYDHTIHTTPHTANLYPALSQTESYANQSYSDRREQPVSRRSSESSSTASSRSSSSLLQSYGEQDYSLREMTWPQQYMLPEQQAYPQSRDVHNDSHAIDLTDEEVMQGEAFIEMMEQKRLEYDIMQQRLLSVLQFSAVTSTDDLEQATEILTELCHLYHTLYGGDENEVGIEFMPSENSEEDRYILEKIDELVTRHKKALVESDRLCAKVLLERRGPEMNAQKLDSLLEEHIKLRGYMRTVQTKAEIKAYNEVHSKVKADPQILYAEVVRQRPPVQSISTAPLNEPQASVNTSAPVEHPIISKLTLLQQAKYKMKASRGRTVLVDTSGHTRPVENTSTGGDDVYRLAVTPNTSNNQVNEQVEVNRNSIWNPMIATNDLKSDSSDEDDDRSKTDEVIEQNPGVSGAAISNQRSYQDAQQGSSQISSNGFMVVTVDPKYVAGIEAGSTEAQESEHVSRTEGHAPLRTGIISGNVQHKADSVENALKAFETHLNKESDNSENRNTNNTARSNMYSIEDSDDDDDDLLAAYQKSLGVSALSDDDDDDIQSYEGPVSSQRNEGKMSDESDEATDEQLRASQKLNTALSEAIWENRDNLNQESFSALLTLWQSKDCQIVNDQGKNAEEMHKISGRELWKKAKDQLLSNKKQHNTPAGTPTKLTSSASMQTSIKDSNSAGVQTDDVETSDAQTIAEELNDPKDNKKIKRLDVKFVKKLVKKDRLDEDVNTIISKHLADVRSMRKQRDIDRLRALQNLQNRSNDHTSNETGDDLLLDDYETDRKLEEIDKEVTNKLLRETGLVSDDELQKVLKKARKQQDEVIKQRNIERVKQNEKIRQRLLEKRKAKLEQQKPEEDSQDIEISSKNEEFFTHLKAQLASGTLTNRQFSQLLESHLSNLKGGQSLPTGTNLQNDKETASSVVRKGKEVEKTILEHKQNNRAKALELMKQRKQKKHSKNAA